MVEEGIITLSESRENVNAMKKARDKKILGLFSKESANKALDIAKIVVKGVGTIATIVASLSPAPTLAPAFAAGAGALTSIIDKCKGLLALEDPSVNQICAAIGDIKTDAVTGYENVRGIVEKMPDRNLFRPIDPSEMRVSQGQDYGKAKAA